ncbi:HEAT repeat domain-containing protein [Ammoniphilus sp. YIM 78166]|uniref:HEAT repeat domain-containing protein n=1 Tax=Ammoniphilus sp. YIM 78166 TaxID=1644106 RepID=UPI00106F6D86|nr:HEAT repeat domain-containing protein [Ammoniphilus sp. YIM 78166]
MYINLDIAKYFLVGLVASNLIFALVIYGLKMIHIRKAAIRNQFQLKFKDYLTYIQVNLDSEEPLRVPPIPMNPVEREALQERLNDMIESFTGEQRKKLMELCVALGFVSDHMSRLKNGSYRIKLDAAYHLGCMRVTEAIPGMLDMLRQHKLDSSLFVIARAVAKCARHERDIKEMVHILLQHGKGFYDLIVDMVEEAPINQTELFAQFIQERNPDFIRIGLTGLKEYTNPKVTSAVYRLLNAHHQEIQKKAAEVYLKGAHFLPKNVAARLLEHDDADIRLQTVATITEFKNSTYVSFLKKSLQDREPRVVHASAIGLTHMGQAGVSALCEGAGESLQSWIQQEIDRLSTQLHDLDSLARYNALKYTYEKTFTTTNKRIYRVV